MCRPRSINVFLSAPTRPVYFPKDGSQVREEVSSAYLKKDVMGVTHGLGIQPKSVKKEDLHAARQEAEEALVVYQKL